LIPKRLCKRIKTRSISFKKYKKDIRQFNFKRLARVGITVGVIAANVGAFYLALRNKKLGPLEEEASKLRLLHQDLGLFSTLEANRIAYDQVIMQYEKERKKLYLKRSIGIPLACISTFVSQKFIRKMWSKKLVKPRLEEDKNPFVFNSLEFNYMDATSQLSLKFEF